MTGSVFKSLDLCGSRKSSYAGDPEPNYEDDEHWITAILNYLNYMNPKDRLDYENFIEGKNKGES